MPAESTPEDGSQPAPNVAKGFDVETARSFDAGEVQFDMEALRRAWEPALEKFRQLEQTITTIGPPDIEHLSDLYREDPVPILVPRRPEPGLLRELIEGQTKMAGAIESLAGHAKDEAKKSSALIWLTVLILAVGAVSLVFLILK